MKNFLLTFDHSQEAENALLFLIHYAADLPCNIILFHSVEGNGSEARLKLTNRAVALKQQHANHHFHVEISERMFNSLTLSESYNQEIDLVVIGTRGAEAPLGDKLFGIHAEEVIEEATWPVLIVPSAAKYSVFRNVVVASDLKEPENEIADVLGFNLPTGTAIHVLHIGTHASDPDKTAAMQGMVNRASQAGPVLEFMYHPRQGTNVIEGIVDFLEINPADLLVLHHRHIGGLKRFFTSGVSEKMISRLHRPLLIFPRIRNQNSNL